MNANSEWAIVLMAVLALTSVSGYTVGETVSQDRWNCPTTVAGATVLLIPHESDCSKFYFCFYGHKIVSQCGLRDAEGNRLYFDVVIQGCVWPEDTQCVSAAEDAIGFEEITVADVDDSHSSTTKAPVVIPTECPSTNEDNAVHIAHEYDCSSYYKCNHGEKLLQRCPSGLAFNPAIQVCDWPELAGCIPGDSNDSENSTATESSIGGISTDPWTPESSGDGELGSSTENDFQIPSSTTEAPVVIPTECPSTNEGNAVHIAHEYDCNLYYKCNHGEKLLQRCPSGLAFNPAIQVCDWPELAGCIPGDSNDSENSTATESSIGETSTDPWTPESSGDGQLGSSTENDFQIPSGTTEAPVVIPTECPSTNEGNAVHIAHEYDCNLYYQCSHGEKFLQQCPSGLAFNPAIQVCDWPELAGCIPGDSNDSENSTATESPIGETSTDPWTPESSGDGGLGSSTENDFQIPSSTTEAPVVIPTECPSTNEGNAIHIAHEYDCNLYYKCNHGEKLLQRCPSGLAFNPAVQVCDWPELAGCIPGGSNDSEKSTATESSIGETSTDPWTSESSGDGELGSSTGNDFQIPSSTTEASVVIPTECPSINEGNAVHIAHEYDCNLYYQCSHGEKFLQQCPSGLAFNPAIQVCDWPELAGCIPGDSNDSENSTATESPIGETSTDPWTPESSGDGGLGSSTENDFQIPSSTTEAPVVIPTECPSTNEGNAVHIAHESDCRLFYLCNHGQKILLRCPNGLKFNAVKQVCDWPQNAPCSLGAPKVRRLINGVS